MPKSTATCNSILALIFNATAWADIAENDTSSPLANLYLSLHTASPGVGNSQLTAECKGFEETRAWQFHETLEEAKASFVKHAPAASAPALATA